MPDWLLSRSKNLAPKLRCKKVHLVPTNTFSLEAWRLQRPEIGRCYDARGSFLYLSPFSETGDQVWSGL